MTTIGNQSFSATIEEWAHKVNGAIEAIFRESVQELVDQADELLKTMVYAQPISPSGYVRTGFLRSSLVVSNQSMPSADRPKGTPDGGYLAEVEIQIAGAELGETIYIGWTAKYGPYVHYGANGQSPRPWVDLVAQRWQMIVAQKTVELKSRLEL